MAYIQAKKIWTKQFSEKEVQEIWELFLSLCPQNTDWENIQYVDFFRENTSIPYPETDKHDDTEGIKPKQMKELIEKLELSGVKLLLSKLKEMNFRIHPYYEDGYISWKNILNDKIFPLIKDKPKAGLGKFLFEEKLNKYYSYDDEIYSDLFKGNLTLKDFEPLLKMKLYKQNHKISKKDLSMENFWDDRKELWKQELGVIPQVQELLLLEPKFWDKDSFLSSLEFLYGVKQFTKLNDNDRTQFLNYYKVFGPHIKYINSFVKERKVLQNGFSNKVELYHLMKERNQAFIKLIEETKKGIDNEFSISDLEKIMISLTYFDEAKDSIIKKQRIKFKDVKSIIEAADLAISYIKSGNEKALKNMKYSYMNELNKYNLSEQQKKWALALFEKTSHLKTKVPLFQETYGDYTIEMIDKNDIRGLVCGNAVNCCQTLGSDRRSGTYGGSNCVYYGAEEETSTFFIISKNNRIIAQSWVWMKGSQLTFDNIEVLGQEVRDSIAKCYQLYANYVLKADNKIKRVTVGTGNSDLSLSKFWKEAKNFEIISEAYDARNSQYEIEYKEVK